MRTSTLRWPALVCASLLAACGPSPDEQASRRWQAQYQAEQHLREQAEARATVQEEARSRWQNLATVLAMTAVVLLILGTILGSAARHASDPT